MEVTDGICRSTTACGGTTCGSSGDVARARPKRGHRRRIAIDWQVVDALCAVQCTLPEIAGVLGVAEDTIQRAVKREFAESFAAFFARKRGRGLATLRRRQWQSAMAGNSRMLVWLGKQYLGQRDKHELTGVDGGPIATADVPMTEAEAVELYCSKLKQV